MRVWLLLIAVAFVIGGCTSGPSPSSGSLTGTQGVVVSQIQIPNTIYEGEEFSLSYELSNRGAYDISSEDPGYIFVSHDDLYLEFVGLSSQYPENLFTLDGRTRFYEGSETFVNLHFRSRDIQRFSEQVSTNVLATVCYPYESNVNAQVCIESNRNPDAGGLACRNSPVSPPTPAAPIGVDQVEVRTGRAMVQGEEVLVPQFRIAVRNFGPGIPSSAGCIESNSSLLNTVSFSASVLNEPLVCQSSAGEGLLRFSRGRAIVTCTLDENSEMAFSTNLGNFLSLLSVDMQYTYRESIRTDLVVQR